MKLTPDAYASSVANELQNGFSFGRSRAVDAVQRNESYVRKGLAAGVAPAFVAKRIASKSKQEWGRTVAGLAGGRKGKRSGLTKGYARGRSGTCTPWIPPVWVDPDVASALEASANSPTISAMAGRVFGKKRATITAGTKVPAGIIRVKSGTSWAKGGAKYVSASANSKIGALDTTWVSIETTCVDCDFKVGGVCYAMGGRSALHVAERDKAAQGETSEQTSLNEADCIDAAYEGGAIPAGRMLRVHSSGDTSTAKGAEAIGAAIGRWLRRGGAGAYTYTHAWRRVTRKAFGPLSVLASLNPGDDARQALSNGYGSVTALFTIEEWSERMLITRTGGFVFKQIDAPETGIDWKFIPCPAQYPVDKEKQKEATVFKAFYLSKVTGASKDLIERALKSLTYDVNGIPTNVAQSKVLMSLSERITSAKLPAPGTREFAVMFRRVAPDEKATCHDCTLCFDDQKLGRSKRAIAFRGDHSGGIIATESLLRKAVQQKIHDAAAE